MNAKEPFIIKITKEQWKTWDLDDHDKYQVALSAFYCGYGLNVISDLVQDPGGPEAVDVVRVAPLLGMGESDRIITRDYPNADSGFRGQPPH